MGMMRMWSSIVLVCACVGMSSCAPEARTPLQVREYQQFLKDSATGQAEEPLTPELEELQNPWERSGNFEGDIILTQEQQNVLLAEYKGDRNANSYSKWFWPNKTAYYYISTSSYTSTQAAAIEKAIQELNSLSCFKFVKRTSSTVNYIYIKGTDSGCRSNVGMIGGVQNLNLEPRDLGRGCFKHGTIMHELLHAAGFFHMQSTHNRDEYVKVVWDKIKEGHEKNFVKYSASQVDDFGVRYDYGSIMHYSEYGFSTDGSKTLVPLKSTSQTIGQREKLSDKDITKLNQLYKCPGY